MGASETTVPVVTPAAQRFNDGDLVRMADGSRFHDMIGVVTGTRTMADPGNREAGDALFVDCDVYCEHLVKHTATARADKVHPTGGAM